MELEENKPTEVDLKIKIFEVISNQDQLFPVQQLIRNHIDQNKDSYFEVSELEWLYHKIGFLTSIISNQNASGVYYWINKDKGINAYLLSKRLGVYYRTIQYWINKFTNAGLIKQEERYQGEGNCNKFFLNDKLHNIHLLINDLLQKQYGNSMLNLFHKHNPKHWEAIKKWRSDNPKLVKKYHHNSEKGY